MSDQIKPIELLTTEQTAEELGVKPATVEKWRYNNKGPAFIRIGGFVRYRPSAIEDYLQSQTVATGGEAA